jgi:hypothetical protein
MNLSRFAGVREVATATDWETTLKGRGFSRVVAGRSVLALAPEEIRSLS